MSALKEIDSAWSCTDVKVVYADKVLWDKDLRHHNLEMHDFTEIFFILKGGCMLTVASKDYEIVEDDLFAIGPNIKHLIGNKDGKHLEYMVIGIEGSSIARKSKEKDLGFFDYADSYFYLDNFAVNAGLFRHLFGNIVHEFKSKRYMYDIYSNMLASILLINIFRHSDSFLRLEVDDKKNKQIEFVKRYLDMNFSYNINLDYLAKKVGINKFSLLREFKKQYNHTPIDYLQHRRMEVAKKLLIEDTYSIAEIARITGFSSQSYFNQVFKKLVRTSPTRFKNNALKEKKDLFRKG